MNNSELLRQIESLEATIEQLRSALTHGEDERSLLMESLQGLVNGAVDIDDVLALAQERRHGGNGGRGAVASHPQRRAPSRHRDPSPMGNGHERSASPQFARLSSNPTPPPGPSMLERDYSGLGQRDNSGLGQRDNSGLGGFKQQTGPGWKLTYKAEEGRTDFDSEYVFRLQMENRRLHDAIEKANLEALRIETERTHQIRTLQSKVAVFELQAQQAQDKARTLEAELSSLKKKYAESTALLARKDSRLRIMTGVKK